MSRNQQVTRLLKILGLISNRKQGMTVGELVRELEVTPRTIYRDFEALQEAGFPLFSTMEEGDSQAFWKFVDGYRYQVPIPFSIPELMGLHFSRDLLKPLAGTVFADSVTSAMQKVRASLSAESLDFLERVESGFGAGLQGNVNYKKYTQVIALINQAILNSETLALNYHSHSSRKTTTRKVNPYSLYFYQGHLYIIGFCHTAGEVRTFAVERVKMADKTGHCFQVPKDFSLEEYFKDSFGIFRQELTPVKVYFDKKVAPFVLSKEWHPSQKVQKEADGGVVLEFNLAGTREVKTWALGFGDHAEILEPKTLRAELARDLKKMASFYEEESSEAYPATEKDFKRVGKIFGKNF